MTPAERFAALTAALTEYRQHPPPLPDDRSVWPTPWTVWERRREELTREVIQADYDAEPDADRRACILRWNPWVKA